MKGERSEERKTKGGRVEGREERVEKRKEREGGEGGERVEMKKAREKEGREEREWRGGRRESGGEGGERVERRKVREGGKAEREREKKREGNIFTKHILRHLEMRLLSIVYQERIRMGN